MKNFNACVAGMSFENEAKQMGFSLVCGLDEAGRGPLAGPVVAAAVVLRSSRFRCLIRDSKKMTALQRERAFHDIHEKAYVGVGIISRAVIDEMNIANATFSAMANAVIQMVSRLPPDFSDPGFLKKQLCLLVDGNRFKTDLPYYFKTIVSGDARSLSIACASVVAKVVRDRILIAYDKIYPQYGFKKHKGYPTVEHRNAIKRYGLSPIHRLTYRSAHDEKNRGYAGAPG